jgi:hypothetical protein
MLEDHEAIGRTLAMGLPLLYIFLLLIVASPPRGVFIIIEKCQYPIIRRQLVLHAIPDDNSTLLYYRKVPLLDNKTSMCTPGYRRR